MAENTNHSWDELVNEFYRPIFRYCSQMLGSSHEAEDVTQEVFIKAFRSLSSLRDPSAARSWMYAIARNRCRDRQRWWTRTLRAMRDVVQETEAPAQDPVSAHLKRLIAALPVRQREVFVLRHLHGFSTEESAKLLQISTGTVKTHLKRAVDTLKDELTCSSEVIAALNIEPSENLRKESVI